jgi:hypothetical protein
MNTPTSPDRPTGTPPYLLSDEDALNIAQHVADTAGWTLVADTAGWTLEEGPGVKPVTKPRVIPTTFAYLLLLILAFQALTFIVVGLARVEWEIIRIVWGL